MTTILIDGTEMLVNGNPVASPYTLVIGSKTYILTLVGTNIEMTKG